MFVISDYMGPVCGLYHSSEGCRFDRPSTAIWNCPDAARSHPNAAGAVRSVSRHFGPKTFRH